MKSIIATPHEFLQYDMIKNRILNEHRKYAHKEQHFEKDLWAEMAARKIVASLFDETKVSMCLYCKQMTHTYNDGACTKCKIRKPITCRHNITGFHCEKCSDEFLGEEGEKKHCFWHGQFTEERCPECVASTKVKTMHDAYGDESDHPVCEKCGFCIKCGDCKEFGCGAKHEGN